MARYRKRPIEVEAEQWFPGKKIPGVKFWPPPDEHVPYVTTIQEQQVSIKAGEWVIQEGDGVHAYPCDPVKFEQIYEPCPVPDHSATDSRRLDWLAEQIRKEDIRFAYWQSEWQPYVGQMVYAVSPRSRYAWVEGSTLREAIDAAMDVTCLVPDDPAPAKEE